MAAVTLDRLEEAIRSLALLIHQTGEDFWPILERLETERDALVSRQARLAAYIDGVKPPSALDKPRRGTKSVGTPLGGGRLPIGRCLPADAPRVRAMLLYRSVPD